jgi:dipeptidyl aminopeptidase/acylaminoacyl peptidase
MQLTRPLRFCVILLAVATGTCTAEQRRFTVSDDIATSRFGDLLGTVDSIVFSPDNKFFVVDSQRGLLRENRSQSTLRFYRTDDIRQFLLQPEQRPGPSPIWELSRSTYENGPIITCIQWLSDAGHVAFLAKTVLGANQLMLADVKRKTIDVLTPRHQDVSAYDIRDRSRFVYAVSSAQSESQVDIAHGAGIVGTGQDLFSLMSEVVKNHTLTQLWVFEKGRRFRVEVKGLYATKLKSLKISPDGRSLVVALALKTVPEEWKDSYPPPTAGSAYRIRPGIQNLDSWDGYDYVSEYATVDVTSGKITPILDAPIGLQAGWWAAHEFTDWSADSTVLLSNTFLPPTSYKQGRDPQRPCVAVVELTNKRARCLEYLPKEGERDFYYIDSARFTGGSGRVVIRHEDPATFAISTISFIRNDSGEWSRESISSLAPEKSMPFHIGVKQSFKDPPVLVVNDDADKISRVILDPNPQLRETKLANASLFTWRDASGHEWTGGLYKPPDYVEEKRYPLVIQTHGFTAQEFRPFGTFPTAGAAQELAASEIVVLQTPDCPMTITAEEGACNVGQYESAIRQLVDDGIVDTAHIGIIGFSRTCYYVLLALTTSQWRFQAASITDGVSQGYLQYLITADYNSSVEREADAIIGEPPFGNGLVTWLRNSPTFNLDKVTAPLQVVAIGRLPSVLSMWEPYAALRLLKKPVDLVVIPHGTHVLTSPADRLVSQGGTVDWFRFWLQGYEDPSPAKSKQYARWRELRKQR